MKTIGLKTDLHKMIDSIEDNTSLNVVYSFLKKILGKSEKKDFWDDLTAGEKNEIEAGLKDLEDGNTVSHEEVLKQVKSRFNN